MNHEIFLLTHFIEITFAMKEVYILYIQFCFSFAAYISPKNDEKNVCYFINMLFEKSKILPFKHFSKQGNILNRICCGTSCLANRNNPRKFKVKDKAWRSCTRDGHAKMTF